MSRVFKRCLITGITGSGGSYLAEHILEKNKKIDVFGLYRSKGFLELLSKKYPKKIKFSKLDLRNYKNLKSVIKKIKPDVIFHLASNANVRESFDDPIKHAENNNIITINLLEALRILNLNPIVVICSSSEVYGNVKKHEMPIDESFQISPINPYAATKAYQDVISQVYSKCYKMNIIITRMFSYTNARRTNLFQSSFAKQIAMIEKGKIKNKLKHGNLRSVRTFVDIEDAMEAYWLSATKGKVGEIYNIGGNKTISVGNYMKELMKLSKLKINVKADKNLFRPQDIDVQIPNTNKFKKHTGWKTNISFKESVENLLNYCRENY